MQTQNSCWLLWLHPPPSSPTGIVCSMETKLAHSWILISQAWGGDASSWPRSQVSKATRRSLFTFCPSHLTAKPVKTAGTRGGASAGDWGTALQTRLRQVCGGGMFLHVTPWARFLFYGTIKSLGNFDLCVCVCLFYRTGYVSWKRRCACSTSGCTSSWRRISVGHWRLWIGLRLGFVRRTQPRF